MATKKEMIEVASISANGGPLQDYRKYHPKLVAKYLDAAINSLISQQVESSLDRGENYVDSGWIKTINRLIIQWDSYRGMCYVQWPFPILMLKQDRGIREIIWPHGEESHSFDLNPSGSYPVLANLECSDVGSNVFVSIVEGDKVYFPTMPQIYAKRKRTVVAKVIGAASSYNDNEELPIPESQIAQVYQIMDNLMTGLKNKPMKVSNDSNPNTI